MNNTQVLDIMHQMFQLVLKLALLFLPMSMVMGVTIAIFQAVVRINEQTIGFVPKLLSILTMMEVLGSPMPALLQDSTRQILSMITGGQFCMFIPFSLIIMRVSGAVALGLAFGRTNVPSHVKAAFILVISLMLYIGPGGIPVHESAVMAEYGVMLIKELLLGFTPGFGTGLTFLAVRLTSAIMDYPMGPTMTQVYDPWCNAQMTTTTGTYCTSMVMLFLATNGHLRLPTIFFTSCEPIPSGTVTFKPEPVQAILLMSRESIAIGLQFAFPLIAMELAAETAMGILMQMIPQTNIFVADFQIKIIVGVLMLLFLFSLMSDRPYVILNGMYQSLQQTVTLMRQETGRKRQGLAERNGQEKAEKPTDERRSDARKRGNVFQSKDVSTVVMLLGASTMARPTVPHMHTTVRGYPVWIITGIGGDVAQLLSPRLLAITVISFLKCVLPLLLTVVVLGILSYGAQTRFNMALQTLQPGFSKSSPITGIKNPFFLKKVVELLRNLIKISLLPALLYNPLKGDIVPVARMTDMNLFNPATYMMNMVFDLVIKICMTFTIVTLLNFSYQCWEYERDLKMTRQEVKDKYKQTEGNPEVKGRIRRIQRQMALNRMIQGVPQADAIARNPAHFAVALKYDLGKSGALIVLAKGQDELALQIIKAEEENSIVVIENRPLTRAPYASCELGREIPAELYGVAAEILAFIYKANHREDVFR